MNENQSEKRNGQSSSQADCCGEMNIAHLVAHLQFRFVHRNCRLIQAVTAYKSSHIQTCTRDRLGNSRPALPVQPHVLLGCVLFPIPLYYGIVVTLEKKGSPWCVNPTKQTDRGKTGKMLLCWLKSRALSCV